jgi:uncharacterized protein YegP (UPF0339 family)
VPKIPQEQRPTASPARPRDLAPLPLKLERLTKGDHFELYRGPDGWRWRAWAANGRILANGGQGYSRRADALRGLRRVRGIRVAYFRDGGGTVNVLHVSPADDSR